MSVQAYSYDANRNRTVLVDPDGGFYTSTCDSLDLVSVIENRYNRVVTGLYDADNRQTTLISGPSAQTRTAYDALGRIITLIETNSAASPVVTTIDSYDPGGRKTGTTKNGVVTTYTNDAKNRLLGQTVAGGVATFAYDAVDNDLLKWYQGQYPQTMVYNVASQLVTMTLGAAQTNYTYNQAGAQTSENTSEAITGYAYDGENRPVKKTNPLFAVTSFSYSGEGLRRNYQLPGQPVRTIVWDGSDYLGEI